MSRRAKAAGLAAGALAALAGALAGAGAEEYEIRLPASAEIALGGKGTVSLTVAPRPGYTISREGPLIVELAAQPERGLSLPRERYRRRHAADRRADAPRFDLRARGEAPGDYTLSLSIRFWICARKTCRPVREAREVPVAVPAPPPDAGPPDGGKIR